MSDLLIKNLELPKEDRIQLSVYPNGKVINHSSFTDTTLLSVELPPHGKLKDADAIVNTTKGIYCKGCNNYGGAMCRACLLDDCLSCIDDAPTVLEASKQD